MDINIASIGSDGSYLAANYKPFNGVSDTINLSLGLSVSGSYELFFNNPADLGVSPEMPVFLMDVYKNRLTDLRYTQNYAFDADINIPATLGNSRFKLIVGEMTTGLPEESINIQDQKYYLYPVFCSDKLFVYHPANRIDANITLSMIDVSGKVVQSFESLEWDGDKLVLDITGYQTGIYFIRIVKSDQLIQTLKWVKK
jgi:hypothetical protein